jgi:hypothetical protein
VSLVFAALSAYLAYILHMRAIGSRS